MEKGVLEMIQTNPILITGCARSGTSMVAGVVNVCGAFGGKIGRGNKYNAKGLFENQRIRIIDKEYLTSIGMDPKGQKPLPDTSRLPIPKDWRGRIEQAMLADGYTSGPWFYKGARNCLTWPVWHSAFPNGKWVIVRRRSADIAESCLKTSFMNAYTTYEDWIKWINHHEKCFVEMIQEGVNVKQVWPERIVKGDYEQMQELIEWLGLTWDFERVKEFIEPKLWKSRQKLNIENIGLVSQKTWLRRNLESNKG